MKEFIAEPGGRYTYADDIINLQDMVLGLSTLFSACSNFIISGCVASGTAITPGYVWLNGKVRRFEGCNDAVYPYYIYEKNSHETVAYANEVNKRGRCCYLALGGTSVPETTDAVTGVYPQFIEITTDYAPRLLDKFFGRYALMTDSPFTGQTVRKDLLLTGTLTVEKGIESKHSFLIAPAGNNYVLRGYFPEAGIARIEVTKNPAGPVTALQLNSSNGEISIISKGIACATFYDRTSRFLDLSSTTARLGSLYVSADQFGNTAATGDKGSVRVNYTGYQQGVTYYRNFEVYDGKKCAVPLLQTEGATRKINVGGLLCVDAGYGIRLTNSDQSGSLQWLNAESTAVAGVGFLVDGAADLTIENTLGGLVLTGKTYVDVKGDLRIDGASVALTYATQKSLEEGLKKKVDAEAGKGLSTKDFTAELCAKLEGIKDGAFAGEDTTQSEGYASVAQVSAELKKKANLLLDGLDEGQRQTAAQNLNVYSKKDADDRFGRLTELFQDFITYLVGQGKSSTEAQQILREKLGAAGSQELADNYVRRDGKLGDLTLPNDEARKLACKTLGAAYAADYEPKIVDTGWMQMSNSGSGTDTRELFVRQIGNIVCIQGRINTARRDGSNWGGVVAVIPNKISPPKYGVRLSVADFNDDHKYNRGTSFMIDANSRKVQLYESGMYNNTTNLNFSYMV